MFANRLPGDRFSVLWPVPYSHKNVLSAAGFASSWWNNQPYDAALHRILYCTTARRGYVCRPPL
ncbi:MAG: hypothetical protein ACYSWO_22440, partial [Planctomycetota bacterium]